MPLIDRPDHLVLTCVERTGATQKIRAEYVRVPDLNLIEISELLK